MSGAREFKNQVVVVTGSAANIGRAIASKFASLGAQVVLNAKNNVAGGHQVAQEIQSGGGEAIFVQADVSSPEGVSTLFQKTVEAFGTIDVLINNAGGVTVVPVLQSTKHDWQRAFDDNLFSSVLCSIEAAKIMQNKGGAIINMSSLWGVEHTGRPNRMPYSVAKAALSSFTKTLAKELAPKVTVNAVAPGFTATSAFDDVSEEVKAQSIDGSLIKRWLTVDEVADAFIYLAGASGITGEVLVIDGGWTLK